MPLRRPAGAGQRLARTLRRHIGHRHDVQAGGAPRLGEEHGAELAGPDQPHAHGPALFRTGRKHPMEVHDRPIIDDGPPRPGNGSAALETRLGSPKRLVNPSTARKTPITGLVRGS